MADTGKHRGDEDLHPKRVDELFSEEEWHQFLVAAATLGRKRGVAFVADEGMRRMSERAWAEHVRSAMLGLGLGQLAARIDPSRFTELAIDDGGTA